MQVPLLVVRDLYSSVSDTPVLTGVDLTIQKGEVHALMGANGSGKSSLANTLLGNSHYVVSRGEVTFEGRKFLPLNIDERARAGLFVAWQNPLTIPGVSVFSLCKSAMESRGLAITSIVDFKKKLEDLLVRVGLPARYVSRNVNEGFSGGEKKRLELMQLMLLQPKFVIFDEVDSGLDVDALKLVGSIVREATQKGTAVLIITHYKRLLEYVEPNRVHILHKGRIVESGGTELVEIIEEHGYART